MASISAVVFSLCAGGLSAQESASELWDAGRWSEASRQALDRDDADSVRMRARFAFLRGEDDDAARFLVAAVDAGGRPEVVRRARRDRAVLRWFRGERDEAVAELRELLAEAPQEVETRFWLGSFLIDDGEEDEGRGILEAPARRFNDGLITDAEELVWLGRSMAAAGRPRDANRAYRAVLRDDEDHLEANLRFGELMWSHYNTAEAEGAFEKVLERHGDHPEALAGMARIEFYRSGRFARSMELVDQALGAYPGDPVAKATRAELLIAQGRWEEGMRQADDLLERAPLDTEGLSLRAAATFLLGRDGEFQATRERFDERRAGRPDLLSRTGEAAAFNRRNSAAIRFFEEALERDGEHAPSLTGIGIALTRVGEESRGLGYLEDAFGVDPYHVRVYNMLEFYDRGLRDYLTMEVEGFRLRAHVDHFDLIRELSEPLVGEALEDFEERYGIVLPALTMEVYAERESFAVRSVGLPNVDPHGICFGPVILTRNPAEGDFNWSLVVWHELAHSFHLALSDYRVPAWFTEGLAEYETYRRDPSWTRFHDVDIARLIAHDRLWSIGELDEVFMTGRGLDVILAYQVSLLVMIFLEETRGFDAIVEILEAYGDHRETGEVFEVALGTDFSRLEAEFRGWLEDRYAGLLTQVWIDWPRVQRMAQGEDVEHGSRGEAAAYRALVAVLQGNREQARLQMENALRRGEEEPAVLVVLVHLHRLLEEVQEGLELGWRALGLGVEGLDLRLDMVRLSTLAQETEQAFVHALSGAMLAEVDPEAWSTLMSAAEAAGEERFVRWARREYFERRPHDPGLARRMAVAYEEVGDYDRAVGAARRWTEIAAMDAEAHLALARGAVKAREAGAARRAFLRASLASPGRREVILQEAARAMDELGQAQWADEFRQMEAGGDGS